MITQSIHEGKNAPRTFTVGTCSHPQSARTGASRLARRILRLMVRSSPMPPRIIVGLAGKHTLVSVHVRPVSSVLRIVSTDEIDRSALERRHRASPVERPNWLPDGPGGDGQRLCVF